MRDDAFRLRSERGRLIAAVRLAEQDEARAEQAELAAGQAALQEAEARKNRQQVQRKLEDAERRARRGRGCPQGRPSAGWVQPGNPCPVCLHKVGKLPADAPVPELEERQKEFEEARGLLTHADTTVAQQTALLTTAQAAAMAASSGEPGRGESMSAFRRPATAAARGC